LVWNPSAAAAKPDAKEAACDDDDVDAADEEDMDVGGTPRRHEPDAGGTPRHQEADAGGTPRHQEANAGGTPRRAAKQEQPYIAFGWLAWKDKYATRGETYEAEVLDKIMCQVLDAGMAVVVFDLLPALGERMIACSRLQMRGGGPSSNVLNATTSRVFYNGVEVGNRFFQLALARREELKQAIVDGQVGLPGLKVTPPEAWEQRLRGATAAIIEDLQRSVPNLSFSPQFEVQHVASFDGFLSRRGIKQADCEVRSLFDALVSLVTPTNQKGPASPQSARSKGAKASPASATPASPAASMSAARPDKSAARPDQQQEVHAVATPAAKDGSEAAAGLDSAKVSAARPDSEKASAARPDGAKEPAARPGNANGSAARPSAESHVAVSALDSLHERVSLLEPEGDFDFYLAYKGEDLEAIYFSLKEGLAAKRGRGKGEHKEYKKNDLLAYAQLGKLVAPTKDGNDNDWPFQLKAKTFVAVAGEAGVESARLDNAIAAHLGAYQCGVANVLQGHSCTEKKTPSCTLCARQKTRNPYLWLMWTSKLQLWWIQGTFSTRAPWCKLCSSKSAAHQRLQRARARPRTTQTEP